MHGTFDKGPQHDQNIYQSWSIKLIALPLLIVIALVGMVVSHPSAVKLISDAAQAEFAGPDFVGPDIAPDVSRPSRLLPANRIWMIPAD